MSRDTAPTNAPDAACATGTHPGMQREANISATRLRSSVTTRLLVVIPLGDAPLHRGDLQKQRRPSPGRDSDMHTRVTGMLRLRLVEHVRTVCSCRPVKHKELGWSSMFVRCVLVDL